MTIREHPRFDDRCNFMCGIVGYVGNKNAKDIIMDGLERLEYRGYDSAGIALVHEHALTVVKESGRLNRLKEKCEGQSLLGTYGMGHTRWATHGAPSAINAHPHRYGRVCVVHNGIIENHQALKSALQKKGHEFASQTDTEVIAHVLDRLLGDGLPAIKALSLLCETLKGAYALAILIDGEADKVFFARSGAPLLVAKGHSEYFIASDQAALVDFDAQFYPLKDGQMGFIMSDMCVVLDLCLEEQEVAMQPLTLKKESAEKNGHKHFMHKEIFEQPETIARALLGRVEDGKVNLEGFGIDFAAVKDIDRIHVVGCGSAYFAGVLAKPLLEELLKIPVDVEIASEFRYRKPILNERTLVMAISQSGETADTVAAMEKALLEGAKCLSICNVVGSALTRLCEGSLGNIYLNAGPEISVASTKAFVAQVCVLKLLTLALAKARGLLPSKAEADYVRAFTRLTSDIKALLDKDTEIRDVASQLILAPRMLYLGRGELLSVALEGALKMKELSYIFAEGYPAGELKHGPIATIDPGMPSVAIFGTGELLHKTLSNLEEIKARGAKTIAIAPKNALLVKEASDYFIGLESSDPLTLPILAVIPLQLLAYHLADLKGFDVDKPRNLAKSVTVE